MKQIAGRRFAVMLLIAVTASQIVIAGFGVCAPLPSDTVTPEPMVEYSQLDNLTFQFWYNTTDAVAYRWSFGDGATSDNSAPCHEYAAHGSYVVAVEVTHSGNDTEYSSIALDLLKPTLDTSDGTLNVGSISVPGVFLLVSCSLFLWMAQKGLHPFARFLGSGGKTIVSFLYLLGVAAGIYLVAESWGVLA